MGGAKPSQPTHPGNGSANTDSTPTPVRPVVLRPVASKPFPLPNGSVVDLSSELLNLLNTAVAQSTPFSPHDAGGAQDECDTRIEIRAAVTTLEMQVLQLGMTVGYTPTGVHTGGVSHAQGKLDVNVGLVGMDFSVWKCVGTNCSAVIASHADQKMTNYSLNFQVDFSAITTAEQLIYNTPFGQVLQDILKKGIAQLANSPRVNELPWHAIVKDYAPTQGSLIFDAGMQSRIAPNQSFTVYATSDATGICNVYQAIAHVRTTQVTTVSSTAAVDQVLDGRKPQAGDVVMIRMAPKQ